ncbi:MAG: cobalamin-dependent protein [Deltaproteobacteria bacterium]|nr:cobalamin-dependent protein [Deltaproteobacteria bacterium]
MKKNIRKILFLYPPILLAHSDRPSRRLPLGIAYIAAWIEKKIPDIEVSVFDALVEGFSHSHKEGDRIYWGVPDNQIQERIQFENPDILAISCQFSVQSGIVSRLCQKIKEYLPNLIIVVGGPHASSHAKEMLTQSDQIDFIISGEGEAPFEALVQCLRLNSDFSDVPGLVFRKDGAIAHNPKKFIENIDDLPFPAWHLLKISLYQVAATSRWLESRIPSVNMLTSRGCPFKCNFCGIQVASGKKFRPRSAESVLQEIDILVNKYGFREIHFEDDNMTLNPRRAEKIFDGLIARNYGIQWAAPSGLAIWTLNETLISKMKQSGCIGANIAIESGNAYTLKHIINKPLHYHKVEEVARLLRKYNIPTTGFWVIGIPGETRRMIWESLEYCKRLGLDNNQIAAAYAYKGTRLYDICHANGFVEEYDPNRITIRDPRIRTPEFSPRLIQILIAADRFLAVTKKDRYKKIPFRLKELWQREGVNAVLVILEIIRHATYDRILPNKGLKGKVYTSSNVLNESD